MIRPTPDEVDPVAFEAQLEGCPGPLKEIVNCLRNAAQHAGADVIPRRYKHAKPNSGWGVSYYKGGNRFCAFDPKSRENHVWAFVKGVDPAAMEADGFQLSKQQGWYKVSTMPEAMRFTKWILLAHVNAD